MASLRDVKSKITGVKKTKQITKAMNMVASAKMRNAQARIERFRPYAAKFYEMLGDLASGADGSVHPLLEVREEVKTVGIVLVTSDRGLCGSFNTNLIKMATKLAAEKKAAGQSVKFYCVGKKGRDAVRKLEYEIGLQYPDAMNSFDFTLANEIGMELIASYLAGDLDEVHLIYGEFVSMARQPAVTLDILPIVSHAAEGEEAPAEAKAEYLYEPSVEGLLAELLPRFIKVQLYRGILDTSASEHAARMAAMDNATKACDDLTKALTLLYNKTRQTSITRELMDIVGGAEALKG
ncbi:MULTISPECIES: F0F1 ATP synthase subunit gamma [Desulfovibrio]|jgi:ATP synthase F1 subcomplex gamma subunit|uniref:F0F1 ATP synthase subunit gamma n=1 Tax=Desulfovibrio TaxID=872 RepID=UPI00040486BE|nr:MULTISPECIES: F0F1 ATP synthase subunit gamma [Desulfovibrio]MDY0305121.1 F0F1 ATP synthase subunit gamma [Desulfovibrionaceae bacterium]HMM39583.1 F0F1 ATP synthase subunit gamma [Desulfovibrio sp.]